MIDIEMKRRWPSLTLAVMPLLIALILTVASGTTSAKAAEYQFCWGANLGPGEGCQGGYRYVNAVWGNSQDGRICVFTGGEEGIGNCMQANGKPLTVGYPDGYGRWGKPILFHTINGAGVWKVFGKVWDAPPVPPANPPPAPPPPSPEWHPAESLGGNFTSDLDISSWGPNRLDVFGRGIENALWHKYWNGSGWSGWELMGGNLASGPSAVSWGPNRIDVVARSTSNTLLHWYWDGTGWKSDNMGGNIVSDPDISSWGTGRLDVFGRGPENALWHRAYDWNYGYFPWESLGGTIAGGPGAVSWAPGRIDIAARTPSSTIAHWYLDNGAWKSDTIPGAIASDPDLSSRGPGRLDLFARSAGGDLQHMWWENSLGWSGYWEGLSGSLVSGPGSVSWEPNNRIDVVGRAADGSASHWGWW